MVRGGKFAHLGQFSTAEEAAVVYARTPEARVCVERLRVEAVEAMCDQLPSTAAACWEQAAAEGVVLLPAHNAAGFHAVTNPNPDPDPNPDPNTNNHNHNHNPNPNPTPSPNPNDAAGFHGVVIHAACRGSHRAVRPPLYSSGRDEGDGKRDEL